MATTSSAILPNPQDSYFTVWANQKPAQKTVSIDISNHQATSILEDKNSFSDVIKFFKAEKRVGNLTHEILPAGNLYYKDSLVLKFSLADKYAGYFPLLRGLFGFGKLRGVSVSPNAQNRTFQIVISSGLIENATFYFEQLFLELTREIKFKEALKDLLNTQREADRTQNLNHQNLYASIH